MQDHPRRYLIGASEWRHMHNSTVFSKKSDLLGYLIIFNNILALFEGFAEDC